MNDTEHTVWLKKHCTRYRDGQCWAYSCLLRGGKDPHYQVPVNEDNGATCEPYEILVLLEEGYALAEKRLEKLLGLIGKIKKIEGAL